MGSPEVPGLPLWFPFLPSHWRAADPGTQRTPASIELLSESAAAGPGISAHPPPAGPDYAVSIRGLTKVYQSGGGARVALDAVDLDLRAGRVTAVLGHNGAGESRTRVFMCIGIGAGGAPGGRGRTRHTGVLGTTTLVRPGHHHVTWACMCMGPGLRSDTTGQSRTTALVTQLQGVCTSLRSCLPAPSLRHLK